MRKREPLSINQPKPIILNVIIDVLFFKFHFLFLHTFFSAISTCMYLDYYETIQFRSV
ncbi:hypothetical protein SAMN05661044_04429 [Olivibacter domesticus]|uniref:Uncharacterized protein n=1 Tax=Olivibacter domesticus TaxID=407022 RepID=A0A1H7W752_OLID1|nr:hypothetical protein SAMN05661044_04429 [Olivibacter domesticus]